MLKLINKRLNSQLASTDRVKKVYKETNHQWFDLKIKNVTHDGTGFIVEVSDN